MCTVSWVCGSGGYQLFSNRDEKRTRGVELAPEVFEQGGVRYLAPVDSDCGGTWLAANECGVSLCLLNGESVPPRVPRRSRGMLPRDLAGECSGRECLRRLSQLDLAVYAGFALAVVDPPVCEAVAEWNGRELTVDHGGRTRLPLTSSSYDAAGVRRFRSYGFLRQLRRAGRLDAAMLTRFHRSHGDCPNAYSPCMHREDAATVSFSRVIVTAEEIRLLYSPAAPCLRGPCILKRLPRAA